MATTYYFEGERLKPAVAANLNSECNFNEVSSHLKKTDAFIRAGRYSIQLVERWKAIY
jgi:hypothetical protein